MTRETRIAMLVGLLFIVMFGLVVSELTGGGSAAAPMKTRDGAAIAPKYAPLIQVRPEAAGERPAPRAVSPESPGGLELARHVPDACSTFVDVEMVRRVTPPPAEPAPSPPTGPESSRGNIERVALVEEAPAAPAPPAAPAKKYVVKAKDNLIKIARAEYGAGNEKHFVLIQQANKELLKGGTALVVGWELVIPPLPAGAARVPAAGTTDSSGAAYTAMGLDDLRRTFAPVPVAPAPASDSVSVLPAVVPAPSPPASTTRPADGARQFHVVRRGDSLGKIAREKMGDDSRASIQRLYKANRDKIRDPDSLPVGLKLEIPV
jgi:nucleoid-associated protein YgaU